MEDALSINGLYWDNLSSEAQAVLINFGYTQKLWDNIDLDV